MVEKFYLISGPEMVNYKKSCRASRGFKKRVVVGDYALMLSL